MSIVGLAQDSLCDTIALFLVALKPRIIASYLHSSPCLDVVLEPDLLNTRSPPSEPHPDIVEMTCRVFAVSPPYVLSVWENVRLEIFMGSTSTARYRPRVAAEVFAPSSIPLLVDAFSVCQAVERGVIPLSVFSSTPSSKFVTGGRVIAFVAAFYRELLLHGLPGSRHEYTIGSAPFELPEHVLAVAMFVLKQSRAIVEAIWGIIRRVIWRACAEGEVMPPLHDTDRIRLWAFAQIGYFAGDRELSADMLYPPTTSCFKCGQRFEEYFRTRGWIYTGSRGTIPILITIPNCLECNLAHHINYYTDGVNRYYYDGRPDVIEVEGLGGVGYITMDACQSFAALLKQNQLNAAFTTVHLLESIYTAKSPCWPVNWPSPDDPRIVHRQLYPAFRVDSTTASYSALALKSPFYPFLEDGDERSGEVNPLPNVNNGERIVRDTMLVYGLIVEMQHHRAHNARNRARAVTSTESVLPVRPKEGDEDEDEEDEDDTARDLQLPNLEGPRRLYLDLVALNDLH